MRLRSAAAALLVVMATVAPTAAAREPDVPECGTPDRPTTLSGSVSEEDARSYLLEPFLVPAGTSRLEVAYAWRSNLSGTGPGTQTVLDLGLWDEDGSRGAEGFRGWSGSRQRDVFVQANAATRGYRPGRIGAGTWTVELGVAAVSPGGATWTVEVVCTTAAPEAGRPRTPFPDEHVARTGEGWYHGDFHMHGYHSHPEGPDWDEVVEQAREAKLDFLPVTEYVTDAHWAELGVVQRQHPDLLVWPGREIITYFGHANALGITPGVIEYRHGLEVDGETVGLGDVQRAVKEAGGLFQVNHPTFFPTPLLHGFCRGCEFTLGEEIDWDRVDTIELLTGPAVANLSDVGGPSTPVGGPNPFVATAIDLWERLLREGHKITPVSGSDSKGVEEGDDERRRRGYGSSATAVRAEELSVAALKEAIEAGDVYIRTRGVDGSPSLDLTVSSADGRSVTFGGSLSADTATMTVTVEGGAGQVLRVVGDGTTAFVRPLATDDETVRVPIHRIPATEGPLGTFWRVETLAGDGVRTTIGNAVFLRPAGSPPPG